MYFQCIKPCSHFVWYNNKEMNACYYRKDYCISIYFQY